MPSREPTRKKAKTTTQKPKAKPRPKTLVTKAKAGVRKAVMRAITSPPKGPPMKGPEKTAFLLRKLNELYPDPPIPLDHSDAFTLLIAVLLSAQTTDKRVNMVTPDLFARARTPQEMAKVPVEEIRERIKTCGLSPQKAKAIHELSKILVEKHAGAVPRTFEELEHLPGVGHKTASVVMSQAFGVPSFPVDTHIHRLAQRWGLTSGKNVTETEKDLKALFPEPSWNKLHLQIIYYGREHCTARGCDGTVCEICRTLYPGRKPVETKK